MAFALDLVAKDLRLIGDLAASVGARMPQLAANAAVVAEAVGAGTATATCPRSPSCSAPPESGAAALRPSPSVIMVENGQTGSGAQASAFSLYSVYM